MTSKLQLIVLPFVIQGNKVEVFVCLMYGGWYLADEVLVFGFHQPFCCIEKRDRVVNANAYIDIIFSGNVYNMLHICERIPWRKAEHQGNRHYVFTRLNDFNNFVISIASTHVFIGFSVAVKRYVQMFGVMIFYSSNHFVCCKAIG